MRTVFTLLFLIAIQLTAFSQTNTFPSSGFVGIGTLSPAGILEISNSSGHIIFTDTDEGGQFRLERDGGGFNLDLVSTNTNLFRVNDNGNVGIGNVNPAYKLEVKSGSALGLRLETSASTVGNPQFDFYDSNNLVETVISSNDGSTAGTFIASYSNHPLLFGTNSGLSNPAKMAILPNGNVGIGTVNPDNIQSWNKVLNLHGTDHAKLVVTESSGIKTGIFSHVGYNAKIGTESNHDLTFMAGYWNDVMTLTTGGSVGIGTLNPAEKLSVNGKVRAHEVKVETNNWPDYVFEESYKLNDLESLEKYIKVNKHLPGIPTAKEVKEEGVNLGEMNVKLLEKIEEMTLLMIRMNAVIKDQGKQLKALESKVNLN